ncbi:MAG: sensor domain-containing diguanylate cyclase [Rhodoferax sp.]
MTLQRQNKYYLSLGLDCLVAGILLLAILVIAASGSGFHPFQQQPSARNGEFDLSQWSWRDSGPVRLDGMWRVYWGELLSPTELSNRGASLQYDNLPVPGNWHGQAYRGEELPRFGKATLALTVKGVEPGVALALKSGRVFSAHRLWIDGVLVKTVGDLEPQDRLGNRWEAYVARFVPKSGQVEIVLEVSNHAFRMGGVFESMLLGHADAVARIARFGFATDIFVIGCLAGLSAYQFSLFAFRRKDRVPLFLAVCCVLVAVYTSANNQLVFLSLAPDVNWELFMKIFYTSYMLTFPLASAFLLALFPDEMPKSAVVAIAGAGLLATVLVWLLPHRLNTYIAPMYQLSVLPTVPYLLWVMGKAASRAREGARLILVGIIVIFSAALNDILFANHVIKISASLGQLAWIVMMFCMSFVSAKRFVRTFAKAEELSHELQIGNALLEQRVAERTKELEVAAVTDQLTGLFNRRKLDEVLDHEVERAARYGSTLSVILGDVDKFKSINDTHGHQAGDQVLIKFAALLRNSVRSTDCVGRWGGEEFLIICPNTPLENARILAEHLRERVQACDFSAVGRRTCSFGVAGFAGDVRSDQLIARADAALYRAKENGRNRVEC